MMETSVHLPRTRSAYEFWVTLGVALEPPYLLQRTYQQHRVSCTGILHFSLHPKTSTPNHMPIYQLSQQPYENNILSSSFLNSCWSGIVLSE